jgi:UDP-N-acetylglucosamine 2-epimerase (non-hydrolysing)
MFFDDLELRPPDRYLSAAGTTAAETIGQVIIARIRCSERSRLMLC